MTAVFGSRLKPVRINELEYLVTGTGRCGTGYTSKLLTALGSDCGHEQIFGPYGIWEHRIEQFQGDSSWLAFPYLRLFTQPIVHLVRDPLRVLRSKLAVNWPLFGGVKDVKHPITAAGAALNPYSMFGRQIVPFDVNDVAVYNMRYYAFFNRHIEKYATYRTKVEKLRDLFGVFDLCKHLDIQTTPEKIKEVIRSLSPTENAHVLAASRDLRWSDLPDCEEKEECMEMSERYGYKVAA